MKKQIHFTFLDDSIKYDCVECKGKCCYVNNIVAIDSFSFNKIQNGSSQYSFLKDFITISNNVPYLSCGQTCWFLSENGCTTLSNGLHKPLTCELYPLKLKKVNDYIIVSYHPCPNFYIGQNVNGAINYSASETIIHSYLDNGVILKKNNIFVSQNRVNYEIEYQENFKEEIRNLITNNPDCFLNKYLVYYLDLRWSDVALSLSQSQSELFLDLLIEICIEVENKKNNFNQMNKYLIVSNEFLKRISKVSFLKAIN